uniref:Uncharacterized protein n=1 Tax=uncultured bacterium contig00017 TaxID=1181508 RepID=A0A806KFR0_9BACT|nr:hypothetical protein [uncultured bacterium contig00017]
MTENMQTSAIMTAGMRLLREKLGLIECEIFISNIKQDRFDYTEWRENLYEDMTLEELVSRAAEFERQHPEFVPKNAKII